MKTQLKEDDFLTIQLLSYDRPTARTERFYFLEMSTLQATTLLPNDTKIVAIKITAYTNDKKYLDERISKNFKTIGDFNAFFQNNSNYYIHDCKIEFENEIYLGSHDDGEASFQFLHDNSSINIINNIFEKYKLDKKLIDFIKNKPGHYITIDKNNNITGDFRNFEDYVKNGYK